MGRCTRRVHEQPLCPQALSQEGPLELPGPMVPGAPRLPMVSCCWQRYHI